MGAEVNNPQFQEVDVQNPTVRGAIRNMIKDGASNEQIIRVVGMPGEVVRSERQRMENEKKGR